MALLHPARSKMNPEVLLKKRRFYFDFGLFAWKSFPIQGMSPVLGIVERKKGGVCGQTLLSSPTAFVP